jgi:hypothetical protein
LGRAHQAWCLRCPRGLKLSLLGGEGHHEGLLGMLLWYARCPQNKIVKSILHT